MKRVGSVYFIRCGDFVKVGFSNDPQQRLRAIIAHTPHDVEIVALHAGSQRDEVTFHRLLALHHHRGEWFKWCAEVEAAATNGLPKSIRPVEVDRSVLNSAIEAIGGNTALARALGISPQAVPQWNRVPSERVLEVERVTGVSRHRLRPDLYPSSTATPESECAA